MRVNLIWQIDGDEACCHLDVTKLTWVEMGQEVLIHGMGNDPKL